MMHLLRKYEALAIACMKRSALRSQCAEGTLHSRRRLHFSCAVRCASFRQNKKTGNACPFVLAEKEGFFANSVACRGAPPRSRFLRFANPWRQKQSPGLFFLALQIPSTTKTKRAQTCSFCFWRRRRDLNPRASCPTYTLSRGASSPLEYFSIW